MNILEILKSASATVARTEFTIIKASKDKKFLLAEDESVFSTTNINKSLEAGLIAVDGDKITLVKGRFFTNQDGITFFTDKEVSTPAF